ncbi:hypothetical protein AAD001_05045 [Colwelliaceae bacterium 6471]
MKKNITALWLLCLLVVTKSYAFSGVDSALKPARDLFFVDSFAVKSQKTIRVKTSKLKDNAGLEYIGAIVSAAELAPFLAQLKAELGNEFTRFRQNQSARDHHKFHVTLINPMEYQLLLTKNLTIGQEISINLLGLGRAAKAGKSAYFVVVQSNDGQFYRQKLVLQNKDFHITLGFDPQDVYGVSKGTDSLIQ